MSRLLDSLRTVEEQRVEPPPQATTETQKVRSLSAKASMAWVALISMAIVCGLIAAAMVFF